MCKQGAAVRGVDIWLSNAMTLDIQALYTMQSMKQRYKVRQFTILCISTKIIIEHFFYVIFQFSNSSPNLYFNQREGESNSSLG